MAKYSTSEFRSGLKVMMDGDPCNIINNEFIKPGKGQAFNRVKLRNLKTGRVLERTFKSGESIEAADVVETDMQYLYNDGESWHFMHPKTFEQQGVSKDILAGAQNWLKEEDVCVVTTFNGEAISIEPPNFVELLITKSDPGVRGDTASGVTKPATLETGATIKVPLFVDEGEVVKIDTRTGEYVSRVKK